MRNNNFTSHEDDESSTDQTRCPFAAHTRKTQPRGDFTPEDTAHHIIRAVTDDEAVSNTTSASLERGLAFRCSKCFRPYKRRLIDVTTVTYQSNIGQGFRFLRQLWVNNAK
ncbi:uncharacterized protein BT62DRAFT_911163 [Guyanagaster necrorhizus]|uniref:Uncharacterized protein n=1 Tax=Guyanagaster necrorhizus TaxID=856835 RepID=A0A9P7VFW1_9AGAR|nr:uncharacterized protein BT62DRAFT_911163 [Guyanagaster necrorhizus MCA 3950]KAG7440188.1 hypothetical protein BT62DRAFT_911163 [Guyanagaster necrorhizus MCA 3950]